jgi:hypothetical protein
MANPITGDFEAVLQVSGETVNRLMATMHQNSGARPHLPSFPHSLSLRIGDRRPKDRVRGLLQAQVSVPRIKLVHGATDRFQLNVDLRAQFRPDPGTGPFPAFVNGTVHAEYHLVDIDPHCFGWAKKARDYLWIRLVRGSVTFAGTWADEDQPGLVIRIPDIAEEEARDREIRGRITRQIEALLATMFEATPHPVSQRFRRGTLRSLSLANGRSAVVIPVGLTGEPSGQIASVNSILLGDSDFGIGVALEYILSVADRALAAVRTFNTTVHVHVSTPWPSPDVDTVYRIRVNPPSVSWQPLGSYAVLKVRIHGSATTDSILPDATFDVEQDIIFNFDPSTEALRLSRGAATYSTHSGGVGSGQIANAVNKAIGKALNNIVDSACAQAQPSLDATVARKQEMIGQLRTVDDQADAHVTQATFLADGMILRGAIVLTSRRSPVATFAFTPEGDGHSALLSWIPGGRIDRFEWRWTWSGSGHPDNRVHEDRFVLRRPAARRSRWGMSVGLTTPVPGIDGNGVVCLTVKGVQTDPRTGALIPVQSTLRCTRFGLRVSDTVTAAGGSVFLHDMPDLSQDVPFAQLALHRADAAQSSRANTLVAYLDETWDGDVAATLREALYAVRRDDSGLVLLVLVKEGVLARAGSAPWEAIGEISAELGIGAIVNEDVGGRWSSALAVGPERVGLAWRLLAPGGGVTWMRDGRTAPDELASALDGHLIPCLPPRPGPILPGIAVGEVVSSKALDPGLFDLDEDTHCPPVHLGRAAAGGSVVVFAHANSESSLAHVQDVARRYDAEHSPELLVVIEGADAAGAEAVQRRLGLDVAALPDPEGRITERFGIGTWPTTVTLDPIGSVAAVEVGPQHERYGRRLPMEGAT